MSSVPDASEATVAPAKVLDYLLNAGHQGNNGKAQFFDRFGFRRGEWERLRDALLSYARDNTVVETETTRFGVIYTTRCALPSPDRRNPCIYSVWIVESDRPPRFVTAFPGPP